MTVRLVRGLRPALLAVFRCTLQQCTAFVHSGTDFLFTLQGEPALLTCIQDQRPEKPLPTSFSLYAAGAYIYPPDAFAGIHRPHLRKRCPVWILCTDASVKTPDSGETVATSACTWTCKKDSPQIRSGGRSIRAGSIPRRQSENVAWRSCRKCGQGAGQFWRGACHVGSRRALSGGFAANAAGGECGRR